MFILNKTNEKLTKSRAKIIGHALLWLVCLFVIGVAVRTAVFVAYMSQGVNPNELTTFAGDVSSQTKSLLITLAMVVIIAPVCEELMFRLGLSFRRTTVALWAALLPLITAVYLFKCHTWYVLVGLVVLGALLYWVISRFTSDEQWSTWKRRYLLIAIWVTAIGFGLVHLMAFSVITVQLLPFVLATILMPFLGGCVMTYARVNLGFGWGILFHILWNVPAILTLILHHVK